MGKSAPKAPDPYAVAEAQSKSNIKTAQEQARLGMSGQSTPYGSLQYVTDPNSPSGYRAVTQFSPEEQALMGMSQDLQAQYGGMTAGQLGRVNDTISTPFDLSAARSTEISDIQKTLLDPQWNARADALQTQLLNRGIRPGSEAYEREMSMFNQQRDDAYNKMFLDAYQTANNAAMTERNIPISDLNALGIGSLQTPQFPQFANTPSPGVAPTDVAGPVMANYQSQMNAYNNQMGGLFGLGSSMLGGWAMKGFPGAAALLSDRRTKQDIERIGDDPRGWGVYRFRYRPEVGEEGWRLGYMADEVEAVRPEAVMLHPSGFKMVNYDALATA